MVKRFRNTVLDILRSAAMQYGTGHYYSPGAPDDAVLARYFTPGRIFSTGIDLSALKQVIVVQADGQGGLTFLARCWWYLAHYPRLGCPAIVAFYIYLAPSLERGRICQEQWEFLKEQVTRAMGNRLKAFFGTCVRPPSLDCHVDVPAEVIAHCRAQLEEQGILEQFRQMLAGNTPMSRAYTSPPPVTGGTPPGAPGSLPVTTK